MTSDFIPLRIDGAIEEAVLLKREKKFLGTVMLNKRPVASFIPHTGRLDGILEPKTRVLVVEKRAPGRRLKYDLIAARVGGNWVVVDTRLANDLVELNLTSRRLPHLEYFGIFKRESTVAGSRFDFVLQNGKTDVLEVESCTRTVGTLATFPDTVTSRSTYQVEKMTKLVKEGYRCTLLFVVMRPDVRRFEPDRERDPVFAKTLRKACKMGVEAFAVSTILEPPSFSIIKEIEVGIL